MRIRRRTGSLVLLGLIALLVAAAPLPTRAVAPIERIVRIEASSYEYDPGVIEVNAGDRVTIELVATDVVHGLYIDGYDLSLTADPGQTGRLTFVADRSGSFVIRCSVTCGPLHPFMVGRLKVGPNWLLWRAVALAVVAVVAGALVTRP